MRERELIGWLAYKADQTRNDENIDDLMAEVEAIFANPDAYLEDALVAA